MLPGFEPRREMISGFLALLSLPWWPVIYVMLDEEYAFGHYPDPEDNKRYWRRMQLALTFPLIELIVIVFWAYALNHLDPAG